MTRSAEELVEEGLREGWITEEEYALFERTICSHSSEDHSTVVSFQ